MTPEALLAAAEAQGLHLAPRQSGALYVSPSDLLTPELRGALKAQKPAIRSLLRDRALGTDWTRVGLWQLKRVLEVAVLWSNTRLVIAPGCKLAGELRATDPKPARIWCSCEVSDLLLSGVTPDDAQKIGEARLIFDATLDGITNTSPAEADE